MARWRVCAWTAWCWLALPMVLMVAGVAGAEEPAAEFLKALRANQYFDAALLYLDRIEGSALVSAEFRAELDYQRGVTLVQAASVERDLATRERRLTAAKESLEKFVRTQPRHPLRAAARRQFALLLREWARMKVERGTRTGDAALLSEAADLFDQARQIFTDASSEIRATLQEMKESPSPVSSADAKKRRDALRAEYLQSLLRSAETLEEKATTAPEGSGARKKILTEAVELYDNMYLKYRGYFAGLRARLYQARATMKLGDKESALTYLTESLLNQTDNRRPARVLKTEAMLLAIECWMDPAKPRYAMAISQATKWLDQIRPAEQMEPNWVSLRLWLARAHHQYAMQLAAADPRDPQIKPSRDAARKLARTVSRIAGDYQQAARRLLVEIPGGVADARVQEKPPPKTFDEAKTNGIDAMSEMRNAEVLMGEVPDRLRREKDERVKKELRAKLKSAEEAMVRLRRESMGNFKIALQLADRATPDEDLNAVRRFLAYLYYTKGDYYDAAVMGEFVGRRFPSSAGARMAAQVALAAYLKLYELNPSPTKEFETDHIISLANYIVSTWSGGPEAAGAINTLIPFLIRQGDLDRARQYVESIPPSSPQRGSAELRIGDALWRDYLTGMNEIRKWEAELREPGAEVADLKARIAARQPQLDALRKTALGILQSGVQRMKASGVVDSTVPRAVLSLAQIYVDTEQADKAIALLDDEKIGVVPMIKRNDPAIDSPQLKESVYRVALGAIVAALPKAKGTRQRAALIQRCRQMIQQLRDQAGDSAEDQRRLVNIFYSLARGLERQIKLVDRPEDRRVMSDGFDAFLDQVRSEATDLRVLNWVADSYTSLGNGLAGDKSSVDAARKCYQSAVATYDQILAKADAFSLTPELADQLRVRKAVALRESGRFDEAMKIFERVLAVGRSANRAFSYQAEAAKTLQAWGAEPKQESRYRLAVIGTPEKTKKKVVWGWNDLASAAWRDKKLRDAYHRARYSAAYCYYKYALRKRSKKDRTKYLGFAKKNIVYTQRLSRTMGGPTWRSRYDALLKDIQRALKERPVGLARAKTRTK